MASQLEPRNRPRLQVEVIPSRRQIEQPQRAFLTQEERRIDLQVANVYDVRAIAYAFDEPASGSARYCGRNGAKSQEHCEEATARHHALFVNCRAIRRALE